MNWFLETKMPLFDPVQNVSFKSKVINQIQIFLNKKRNSPLPRRKRIEPEL